ncbi:MAG TPA: ABC transporter ATP-binding protein [Oscillospiraceae bacterium]|nr:ABC transporter ATP-binding protein [Oscillospiraceae bacterium]
MILFHDVSFGYTDDQLALRNVNLKITHGESIAVVGANGAGKSTLLRLATGELTPKKGSITVDGIAILPENSALIQKKIGYAGQKSTSSADLTVKEYLENAPRCCGYSETEIKSLTDYAIKIMHLESLTDRNLLTLSYGERRTAAVAAMLSKQPSVMILDDPTAFVDATARHSMTNTLQILHHTKVIATHDLDLALALCTKVVILKEGSIYAYGNAQTLLRNVGLLQACNLELPLSVQKYNAYAYK